MQTELEARILGIDIPSIQEKLKELGAQEKGSKLMRRYVYDFTPVNPGSWIRLRDNGSTTTLTIKEIENDQIDGTKELEITVDSFDKTHQLLNKLGYTEKAYQENRRTSYCLDGIDIEIDEWPQIPPYLELEGKTIEDIHIVLGKIGYDISQTTSKNTLSIYAQYGIELEAIKHLSFE